VAVKDTLRWVRDEWGIFANSDEMTLNEVARWLSHWVPFGARTIAYGSISCALGPLTKKHGASAWCQRQWSKNSLEGIGVIGEVEGAHRVPAGGVMYASNHQSLLDILVLGALLPGDLKWATKRSIMRVPFLGWHLALAGHVPVDRKAGSRAAAETIKRFRTVLEEGETLLVFPEGTRTPDGEVQPFKSGGFYAAVRANVPVVPVALDGTFFMMRKHASDSGDTYKTGQTEKRTVRVCVGEPIKVPREGKEKDKVAFLREATQVAVTEMHRELRAASAWRQSDSTVD
jgi:1-acyl-sn-glycerol-3-phosphate acyltransferase